MVDVLGYNNVINEVLDVSAKEQEISDYIDEKINPQVDDILGDALESLSNTQLVEFLTAECFPDGIPKNYSQIKKSPYINFAIRAALQMMGDNNSGYYTIDGSVSNITKSDNNKTIDDWLISRGGITNEYNGDMTKFLQKMVGAHPDGFIGPQTIYKIIENLSGTVNNNLAEGVNTLYKGKEKFQVMNIGEYTHAGIKYKYDEKKIKNGDGEGGTYSFEFNNDGVLITDGLKVEKGWIVLDFDLEKTANALYNEGYVLFKEGKNEEALKKYEAALEKDPKNDGSLLRKGEVLLKMGNYREAKTALELYKKMYPNNQVKSYIDSWIKEAVG